MYMYERKNNWYRNLLRLSLVILGIAIIIYVKVRLSSSSSLMRVYLAGLTLVNDDACCYYDAYDIVIVVNILGRFSKFDFSV
jgi:hypothetical protein